MTEIWEHIESRRVEFSHTDLAGIVHFSNYFRYMEMTEHGLFRSMGLSIVDRENPVGWPRVSAHCDFRHPLKFEDIFEDRLLILKKSRRSLEYLHVLRLPEADRIVAIGRMSVVCVAIDETDRSFEARVIPDSISNRLVAAPPHIVAPFMNGGGSRAPKAGEA